ncbi:MAG: ribosomal protein S18-alanine N-acetyltransferase [Candidatus Contendobacter sp.]|nr:ribosomal protein S18-alanine N-acetyltransferase [Candidatus Contendobacter sp.]MDS4028841.1 ribosomal protein S18-alanine N-acetyltransferase [Candidatus Contendobacter sp.]MDS4058840.1 ribosomal protein S18-alanine N-acetyltransferase [Candidatus Contendobacter sp.]
MNAPRELGTGRFRPMLYADLKEILAIERRAYDFAWTNGILRDCLRAGYHCRVLETPHGFIQAYAVMSTAVGEAHILNFCVRPELQGRGLARRMLDHLLDWARLEQVRTVFLEVRLSNTRAARLYASAGFCEVGLRPGYYPSTSGREDALVMAKEL